MKIGVYYIVTGAYKQYFEPFIKTLHNFFPSEQKIVKLISDGLEEWDNYEEDNIRVELCPRINHYPWPIVTLYKHWHILQNWDDSCDYMCYFNTNSEIMPNRPDKWCDFNKLNVSYHSWSNKPEKMFPNATHTRKESAAYIEPNSYEYIQGGFFFGNKNVVKEFCNGIIEMVNKDSEQQIYAEWHDESYANKWVYLNQDKVHKGFMMTAFDNYLSDDTFIKLPIKDKKIEDFKETQKTGNNLSIAIVGNSPCVLEHDYGEEIDSHDIVIRFNNFKTAGFEKHCGSKTTDIAFTIYNANVEEVLKLTKPHRLLFYATETEERLKELIAELFGDKMTLDDVSIIDNEKYYKQLRDKLHAKNNWQGSTGLVMCQKMADDYPEATIDVYGITFFKDSFNKNNSNNFSNAHHMDGSIITNGHDHEAEWAYYEKYLKDKINLHI